MKNNCSTTTTWNDMPYDILVTIFMALDILDLLTGVSHVCSSWRAACFEPTLWWKIDLSRVKPDSVNIPRRPNDVFEDESSNKLLLILKNALKLSHGNVSCLIFHFHVSLRNEHLICAAERSKDLKRLVLPAWNKLDAEVFECAVMYWTKLVSLTVPCVYAPCSMMRAIGTYCKNFSELKIMCPLDYDFAHAIVVNTPQLKVLSLRCTVVFKEALILLLEGLQHLEVLNLSHSLMVTDIGEVGFILVYRDIDSKVTEKASHLKMFLTCQKTTCPMCKFAIDQEEILKWYDYDEVNWRIDEVPSFAVGLF